MKEKDIGRNSIVKKERFICEISIVFIFIFQKLGSVGPVQQKMKLYLGYMVNQYYNTSM